MGYIERGITQFSFDTTNSISFTRPNDTTQYAIGDAISDSTSAPTPITFSEICDFMGGTLVLYEVIITSSAKQGTLPQMNLWLFNTIPTATNDNSALSLTDTQNNTCIAVIPLTTSFSATNNSRLEVSNLRRILRLASSSKNLYGLLEATNTYTPVANEVFTITIKGKLL